MSESKQSNNERLSRTLTKILRHKATDMGIKMSEDGYVKVDDLLNKVKDIKNLNATEYDIRNAVAKCPKQRFQLNEEGKDLLIRCSQGHSIKGLKSEELYTPITLDDVKEGKYPCAVHGTYKKAWKLIQESGGLSPMGRTHIHFSSKPFGSKDMISGMRSNAEVLLEVDLAAAITAGHKFWIANNEVILCDSKCLPLIYLTDKQNKDLKN
jgi:2'-phosphotransferase